MALPGPWSIADNCRVAAAAFFAALAMPSFAGAAAPAGFTDLPEQRQTITVGDHSATISYRPAIKLPEPVGGDGLRVPIYVEGDLAELQDAVAGALAKQYAYDECGDRLRAHSVSLRASGDVAQLVGTVKYERWECIKARVPEFKGLKVTFKDRIITKTRLVEQSATICIDLRPVIEDDGRALRLDAQVTCARPSEHSLLGRIGTVVSLEGQFKSLAQDAANKAQDSLRFSVPEEIRQYDPRVTHAAFVDLGGGRLGIVSQGYATVTLSQLVELLAEHGR